MKDEDKMKKKTATKLFFLLQFIHTNRILIVGPCFSGKTNFSMNRNLTNELHNPHRKIVFRTKSPSQNLVFDDGEEISTNDEYKDCLVVI